LAAVAVIAPELPGAHGAVIVRPLVTALAGTVWRNPRRIVCIVVAVLHHVAIPLANRIHRYVIPERACTAVTRVIVVRRTVVALRPLPLVTASAVAPRKRHSAHGRCFVAAVTERARTAAIRVPAKASRTATAARRKRETKRACLALRTLPLVAALASATRGARPAHSYRVSAAVRSVRAEQRAVRIPRVSRVAPRTPCRSIHANWANLTFATSPCIEASAGTPRPGRPVHSTSPPIAIQTDAARPRARRSTESRRTSAAVRRWVVPSRAYVARRALPLVRANTGAASVAVPAHHSRVPRAVGVRAVLEAPREVAVPADARPAVQRRVEQRRTHVARRPLPLVQARAGAPVHHVAYHAPSVIVAVRHRRALQLAVRVRPLVERVAGAAVLCRVELCRALAARRAIPAVHALARAVPPALRCDHPTHANRTETAVRPVVAAPLAVRVPGEVARASVAVRTARVTHNTRRAHAAARSAPTVAARTCASSPDVPAHVPRVPVARRRHVAVREARREHSRVPIRANRAIRTRVVLVRAHSARRSGPRVPARTRASNHSVARNVRRVPVAVVLKRALPDAVRVLEVPVDASPAVGIPSPVDVRRTIGTVRPGPAIAAAASATSRGRPAHSGRPSGTVELDRAVSGAVGVTTEADVAYRTVGRLIQPRCALIAQRSAPAMAAIARTTCSGISIYPVGVSGAIGGIRADQRAIWITLVSRAAAGAVGFRIESSRANLTRRAIPRVSAVTLATLYDVSCHRVCMS
jgi:hypothetical protein